MELEIGRTFGPRRVDVRARDALAIDSNLAGDVQECPKLGLDRCAVGVALDFLDQLAATVELDGCEGAVRVLAEHRLVVAGDVGRDQLTVASGQGVVGPQQLLGESVEMHCGLGPELHRASDPGHTCG